MDPQAWLIVIALGGFLGMVGQCARAIVGLKKLSDAAATSGQTAADQFSGTKLLISLLIGFVAGVLAMVTLVGGGKITATGAVDGQTVATLIASGYAGADFIEGFMQRTLPNPTASGTATAKPSAAPSPPPTPPNT